jgi:hypothetical protein
MSREARPLTARGRLKVDQRAQPRNREIRSSEDDILLSIKLLHIF